MKTIYLAGGCFWGVERYISLIPGVTTTLCGYANGDVENPTYEEVCKGKTNFREAVKVTYSNTTLETILFAFFRIIDPTITNRQGNDVGSQYQTGIYFVDDESKKIVEKSCKYWKKTLFKILRWDKRIKKLFSSWKLSSKIPWKNPSGYCHINSSLFEFAKNIKIISQYDVPSDEDIKNNLTKLQYEVTQNAYTEKPFENEFYNFDKKGIYVDIVTGEPLFTSMDKFHSSCGWPAFSKAIDDNVIVYKNDYSHNMSRVEVLSRSGNSHLGHVFNNDPESTNGIRYCINSASLKFIPYEEMDEKYPELKYLFK